MHMVIVGGGFGGTYTAKYLLKHTAAKVTLLSEHNYFLFTPLLHEVATGGLAQDLIVQPLNQLFPKKRFQALVCKAKSIDAKNKYVMTSKGPVAYDYLVLATGASSADHNVPGVKKHAIPLKTVRDARHIRNALIARLEEATAKPKKHKELLSFAVVGGGPTGVELVAEIAEFLYLNAERYYPGVSKKDIRILLLQRGDRLLPQVTEYFQKKVAKQLARLGVTIVYNADVRKVTDKGVYTKKLLRAHTVFWTAGVKPNTIPIDGKKPKAYDVNEFLQLKGHQNIFALGDCARFIDPITSKPVPRLAQVATMQGPVVAKNIARRINGKSLKPFRPKLKGFLVSVGQWFAVAGIDGFLFSGKFAWWVWRTIYLSKLIGFTNKIKVALNWTLNLFFPRDVSQLE